MQQRIVAMKTTQKLPHLPGRAAEQAGRWMHWCVGS
jgi:hypothetical protein